MGWAAHPSRKIERTFSINTIQMGARVYIPSLGRFLQVDPIEGGTLNPYVYAHDPVNLNDYSGRFAIVLAAVPLSVWIFGGAALTTTLIVSNPTSRKVVVNAGSSVGSGVARGYRNALDLFKSQQKPQPTSQSKPIAKSQPIPYSNRPYTEVAPFTAYPSSLTQNSVQRTAAINSAKLSLAAGINPGGFPILGLGTDKPLNNPAFADGWTKHSIPYPALGFEIHYTVNEELRLYSEMKAKDIWDK